MRWLLAALAVSMGLGGLGPHAEAQGGSDYLPHAPILVNGDAGFLLPTSGVTGGLGTAESPYIIENWEIDVGTLRDAGVSYAGISLTGTTAHVIIRHCRLFSSLPSELLSGFTGIQLYSTSNVVLEDLVITDVLEGISLREGAHATIREVTIEGPGFLAGREEGSIVGTDGIHVDGAGATAEIQNVSVSRHATGLMVREGDVVGHGLVLDDLYQVGIGIWEGNLSVAASFIDGAQAGVSSVWANRVWLEDVAIRNASLAAVSASSMRTLHLANMEITNSRQGVNLASVSDAVIRDSTFRGLPHGAIRANDDHGNETGVRLLVENNEMTDVGLRGVAAIDVYRLNGSHIALNRIMGSAGTGVDVGYDAHNSILDRNVVTGHGESGVVLRSNDNVVMGNTIAGNAEAGIELWDVHGNQVVGNDIRDNEAGDILWQRDVRRVNDVRDNAGAPVQAGAGIRQAAGPEASLGLLAIAVAIGLASRQVARRPE